MPAIAIKDLAKNYIQGNKLIKAVDNTSLDVEEKEFIVIIGPSGSGKSTLLQLIGGLDRPTAGSITIDGIDIAKASDKQLARLRRRKIGFIFQSFNLIPTLTSSQNVQAAIDKHSNHDQHRAEEVLELVGLGHRMNHLPSLLSGGEQQRVAIARALVNDPKIILADEPTGNLDSKTGEEVMRLLRDLNEKDQKTIILITHSEYVKKFADRVLVIKDGKLMPQASRK
ncbi:MAG: ABC transporter ATP-binding protein [Patescibacteria group bacterium]|jgi:putative ABC transport system ATP-binding protein